MSELSFDNEEVTEEIVDYYENNPDELDLIINKEYFHSSFLGLFFFLGLIITILARVAQFFFKDQLGEFVNMVILDLISEFGIAIFGGAVVAYFIEYLSKKEYQQNVNFRKAIKSKLQERSQKRQKEQSGS